MTLSERQMSDIYIKIIVKKKKHYIWKHKERSKSDTSISYFQATVIRLMGNIYKI